MKPLKTSQIIKNISCVKTGIANFYLYKYSKGYIAIDCGSDTKKANKGLNKLGISPENITHVLLTHSDYDHVKGLPLFTKAAVYMGRGEEQMINKTTPRFNTFKFNKPLATKEYNLLLDTEELLIGDVVVFCIATPGHTPGSMTYLIDNTYLFSGDALSIKKGKIEPFFSGFVMDYFEHLKSIKKIKDIRRAKMIFTGHHGYKNYEK
ncbi:MAG: MBL fold metallo-hydrolase [Clostridiales bacterium]|nr:MBL fold metallo-hydrolase [Clostridiales bacterium]